MVNQIKEIDEAVKLLDLKIREIARNSNSSVPYNQKMIHFRSTSKGIFPIVHYCLPINPVINNIGAVLDLNYSIAPLEPGVNDTGYVPRKLDSSVSMRGLPSAIEQGIGVLYEEAKFQNAELMGITLKEGWEKPKPFFRISYDHNSGLYKAEIDESNLPETKYSGDLEKAVAKRSFPLATELMISMYGDPEKFIQKLFQKYEPSK